MKNTTDRTILVPLISDGTNTGFKAVPNPDYTGPLSSKSYTLDELEQLAREFVDGSDASADQSAPDALKLRMFMGAFLAWARKREREVGE